MAQPHFQLCSLLPVSSRCECGVSSNHRRPFPPPCYSVCNAYSDTVSQHYLSSRSCFWKVFLSQKVTNTVLLAWLETPLSEAPLSAHRMLSTLLFGHFLLSVPSFTFPLLCLKGLNTSLAWTKPSFCVFHADFTAVGAPKSFLKQSVIVSNWFTNWNMGFS